MTPEYGPSLAKFDFWNQLLPKKRICHIKTHIAQLHILDDVICIPAKSLDAAVAGNIHTFRCVLNTDQTLRVDIMAWKDTAFLLNAFKSVSTDN